MYLIRSGISATGSGEKSNYPTQANCGLEWGTRENCAIVKALGRALSLNGDGGILRSQPPLVQEEEEQAEKHADDGG
jgi:hypothetical protein